MMPQMPSREKLLAWIDQVSFAVVEMNLYLDTHPEDEDALAFFREKVELRKEALKQYAEQYGPLTIDTANDRMSRSFEWVMQPWPWEVNQKVLSFSPLRMMNMPFGHLQSTVSIIYLSRLITSDWKKQL